MDSGHWSACGQPEGLISSLIIEMSHEINKERERRIERESESDVTNKKRRSRRIGKKEDAEEGTKHC